MVRLMASFNEMEGMAEKVKIVVNRAGLESGQITLKIGVHRRELRVRPEQHREQQAGHERRERHRRDDVELGPPAALTPTDEEAGTEGTVLAAAAPERIPEGLLQQLAPGGRLVIPVGAERQQLQLVSRTQEGFETEIVEEVRFVPLRSGTVR